MVIFILGGVLILGTVIFIHELGHYLLGRAVGIQAEIFSIGYGKGVWKKKIGPTTWQITAIPLGGYVKFYGDDMFNRDNNTEGSFYAAHPLKRIIPVLGGPLFNFFLGFFLLVVLHTFYGPMAPKVFIWEEGGRELPAYQGGLRNGDLVLSVNDKPIHDFYDIHQEVALSSGEPVIFRIERNGEILEKSVKPLVDSGGMAIAGLRPPGTRQIEVNYPTDELWSYRFGTIFGLREPSPGLRALPYLNEGDIILEVEGEAPVSISDLQRILGENHGQVVRVKVRRQTWAWLSPWITEDREIRVPTYGEYKVHFLSLRDMKYDKPIPDQLFLSSVEDHIRSLAYVKVDGKPVGSFKKLYDAYHDRTPVSLEIRGRKYSGAVEVEKIGLFGFSPADKLEPEFLDRYENVSDIFSFAWKDTIDNILLYPLFFKKLFTGRMSFIENTRGPVGMFAMAGKVFESGFHNYLHLFAAISLALMVMNLLPIPIVDGGHVVFFLFEAVAGRPLAPNVMEAIYRFAFMLLIFLGLWIMYRDVIFFLGM